MAKYWYQWVFSQVQVHLLTPLIIHLIDNVHIMDTDNNDKLPLPVSRLPGPASLLQRRFPIDSILTIVKNLLGNGSDFKL